MMNLKPEILISDGESRVIKSAHGDYRLQHKMKHAWKVVGEYTNESDALDAYQDDYEGYSVGLDGVYDEHTNR